MNKLYPTRINWHNEPSTETPIDEINLNKMDKFCDDIDNRVIEIDGRVTNIEDIEPTVLGYATRAENAASDSEGYAVGKRGGQDVPSTDPTYHNNSKFYSDRALTSETNAATSETNAATSESNASTSATNAHTSETNAADSAETAEAYAIGERNGEPVTSEDVTYHNNSKFYAEQAGTSATNAATSESNASTSETNAATSESNAATSESHAATSETNAATSESNAEAWAVGERGGVPVTSEDETYENNARFYSGNADTKAEFADLRAVDSEAWSVGKRRGEPVLPSDETYHNNAKYWAEIAESVTNVFPMEGATDSTNGKGGLVPQPLAGDNKKALYGDGTWKDVKGRTWLAYIREYGTPFEANWLTLSPTGGVALTPDTEDLYLIKSSGKYYNVAVSWNGTAYEVTSKSAHIIVDEDGVSYPQRDKMKFFNAVIEDDAENDTTKVYVEGTGSIIVTPPTVTVGSYTYNGQPQGPTIVWATGMEDKCVVTNATKTDAGTYTLTIALKNSNRMIWTDMTTADKTYSYTIAKQTLTVPTVDDTGLVYDGTAQSPTITGFDSDTMTKSGDTETDAGSYTVTFGLVDLDNYEWSSSPTSFSWAIAKANQTITLSETAVTLDADNLTADVTVSGNQGTISATSSNTSKATVSVSGTTVTITRVGSDGSSTTVTVTVTAASTTNYNSVSATITVNVRYLKIVTFASGTDAEIKAMLDAYYSNRITWSQMGWAVGNTRKIHLNSMTAPNPNSSNTWAAQDITVVIVAHDHTDLATAINGHTKACITVQTREVLNNNSSADGQTGHIYLNGDSEYDMSFTKWSNLYIRTYMNSTVLSAIPSGNFKSSIKPSKHYRHTAYNTSEAEQVTDTLFLPSYAEISGTTACEYYTPTSPTEGTQFSYYKTSSNRFKYGNNNGASNGVAQYWWEGSASSAYDSRGYRWCYIHDDGSSTYNNGRGALGLAPAWAM